jgi:hypothetical protein
VTRDYDGCLNGSNVISDIGLKSLSIYPNPASTSTTLKLEDTTTGDAVISITNSSGVKMVEIVVVNPGDGLLREIPVSNLEEGIYVVNVLINGQVLHSAKLIVKK